MRTLREHHSSPPPLTVSADGNYLRRINALANDWRQTGSCGELGATPGNRPIQALARIVQHGRMSHTLGGEMMSEFVDLAARFSRPCGGAVRVHLDATDSSGERREVATFVMSREAFTASLSEATRFEREMISQDAAAVLARLPRKTDLAKAV